MMDMVSDTIGNDKVPVLVNGFTCDLIGIKYYRSELDYMSGGYYENSIGNS